MVDAHPCDLVLQGRFSKAVAALSQHLQQSPADTIARANRVAAYLCLGDYAAAALDNQVLIQRHPRVDAGSIG
jgi:Flp pilus assembly protein TadD